MEIIYLMNYYWQRIQKVKPRNAFENNLSTDINLSRAQLSKVIQPGGFLEALLSELAGP